MNYQGGFHCGRVAFEVEGELNSVVACNCPICQRKGSLLWFVPREQLVLKTDPNVLFAYVFDKQVIQHRLCAYCDIHPFGEGAAPNRAAAMAAVDVRCLEGVDLASIAVQEFYGCSV